MIYTPPCQGGRGTSSLSVSDETPPSAWCPQSGRWAWWMAVKQHRVPRASQSHWKKLYSPSRHAIGMYNHTFHNAYMYMYNVHVHVSLSLTHLLTHMLTHSLTPSLPPPHSFSLSPPPSLLVSIPTTTVSFPLSSPTECRSYQLTVASHLVSPSSPCWPTPPREHRRCCTGSRMPPLPVNGSMMERGPRSASTYCIQYIHVLYNVRIYRGAVSCKYTHACTCTMYDACTCTCTCWNRSMYWREGR